MTHTVRLAPPALQELDEAARWYDERGSGLGVQFVDAVGAAAALLSRWPEAGSLISTTGAHTFRRAPVRGFPYHLAYRVVGDVIDVLAVAHDRRRPVYWAGRTSNS